MRFHVPGLPHTLATTAYVHCAYSQKVRNFFRMMMSLGHEVFLYESQNPLPPEENLNFPFDVTNPRWVEHNAYCILEIASRIQPGDFLCLIAGVCQEPIAKAFPHHLAVEFGVGYFGTFSPYCVYESYAHMHNIYGRKGIDRGRFTDTVIPNYYDPKEFPFASRKGNYLLFIGRLNEDKGVGIAQEVSRRTGMKLVVAGQGRELEGVEYKGVVGVEERGLLMAHATALLAPTLYLEPFGGVAVEAQLCGTPVITTDFGAFPETVEQGVTGFRCHSLGGFVEAVEKAKKLSPMVIRMKAHRFTLDVVRHQYQAYFERLMLLRSGGLWNTAPQPVAAEV